MKQFSFFLAFLMLFLQQANAIHLENSGGISGKVVDKTLQQAIPYASVSVKLKSDNSIVTGVVTDEEGKFNIKNLTDENYVLEIQFVGYTSFSKSFSISKGNRNIQFGTITLVENVTELEGVELVAERSTIEQKIDRKVVNVGKDLTTAGASAADIMNNIPSVNLDQDGNLSLRGNQNVRVMVDGKLSNVPVDQLLKQIPSSAIKSIELITNPSAKYNPEGMSGIINIILHKSANIGFNGNVNAGVTQAIKTKFNGNIDLNYRNGKFNVYGNYGSNLGQYVNNGHIYRIDENSEQFFKFKDDNTSHLFKAGFDFYLNDNNTISFFTNQNIFDGNNSGNTRLLYYNDVANNYNQIFFNDNSNSSGQYNFDYKHNFKKEGHNLELEVDYNDFSSDENADFIFSGVSEIPNYEDFVTTERDQTTINLDYVNPLNEKTKLEIGTEARLYGTNVDYNSTGFSYNANGNLVPTPNTVFDYNMDVLSGYVTYGQNFEKWSYQAGARVENVSVKADTNTVRAFTDKYTQIYPSAFVSYKASDKNTYQISFSRRVDRPGLQQVNPIREWSTPRISSYGNPELKPQFTNSIDLNYTRRLKAGSITAGVFYRQINDVINRAVLIDPLDENRQILTFDNFDDNYSYGVEISSNYKPLQWWNLNASLDFFSQEQKGLVGAEYVEVKNNSLNLRLNNNLTITKKLTMSIFAFYRGPNKGLQFEPKAMYFINTGARYSFANNKGTFSLNFNDVFNTMRFAFNASRPYPQRGEFNWESQSVYAGVSYRFGSGKNSAIRRKNRDNNEKQGGGIF